MSGADSLLHEEIPLVEISLESLNGQLPTGVGRLISAANRRIDAFFEEGLGPRYRHYVPGDPELVYHALKSLLETEPFAGKVFCEWGSGFGLAAGIAHLLGWESYGIEIEPELVDRSRQMIFDLGLKVTILETSYLPDGFEETEGIGGKDLLLPNGGLKRGWEGLQCDYDGLAAEEVDLFFVYPWPDQEQMIMDLFRAVASEESVLLMYLGDGEMAAYRFGEE